MAINMTWERAVTLLSVCVAAGSAYLAYSAQIKVSEQTRQSQERSFRLERLTDLRKNIITSLYQNNVCYAVVGFEGSTTDCDEVEPHASSISNESMVAKIYRIALLAKPNLSEKANVEIFGKTEPGLSELTGNLEIDIAYDYDDGETVNYASRVVAALDREIDRVSAESHR